MTLEGEAMPVEDSVDNENICKNYCGSSQAIPNPENGSSVQEKRVLRALREKGVSAPDAMCTRNTI